MSTLKIDNLGMRANGKWALWDVNLEIEAGEIVGVFGRSGSGKSTLAGLIAGLEEQSSGTIAWTDSDNKKPTPFACIALEKPALASELTVYENIDLFAALWGVPRRKRAGRVASLIELLKLSDWRSTRAQHLSSGVRNRVEIARALVSDAPVTVIDSLLDTIDPDIMEKLWDHMLGLRRSEGKSFLILTSRGKIAEMCGRVAVIHRGRISFLGRPDDLRRLAGEDVVVLGDITSPMIRARIEEQISVVIREEEGFLSFRATNGERVIGDLLSEFGTELGCVYLKRPTLEDALDVIADGGSSIAADVREGTT
ncbi:MAG: ABC transporter ATP-binding protein [Armatimonadota bacterium]